MIALNKKNKKNKRSKLVSSGLSSTKGKSRRNDASEGSGQDLLPVFEIRELHRLTSAAGNAAVGGAVWENLDLAPPPGPAESMEEALELLRKERVLYGDKRRQDDITKEIGLDLSAYTRPLGIEDAGGFEATKSLFRTILTLAEYIGLLYKDRFDRLRPNQLLPRLRPFIANPPHASYPSNHSFQSFAIADIFAKIAESEPSVPELYRCARRVAENREYAGVHFASDTEAGRQLAKMCVPYLALALDEPMYRAQLEWQ
jgi:hypothetical protein